MKPREFYDLTKNMREAQKQYSMAATEAERQRWQAERRKMEKRIDDEIARVESVLARREMSRQILESKVDMLKSKGFEVVERKEI